jgi:hypothetical protein
MLIGAVVALAFVTGSMTDADAASTRKRTKHVAKPPAARVVEQPNPARSFDPAQYYERLSTRIPFGTQAWWGQKDLENMAP